MTAATFAPIPPPSPDPLLWLGVACFAGAAVLAAVLAMATP